MSHLEIAKSRMELKPLPLLLMRYKENPIVVAPPRKLVIKFQCGSKIILIWHRIFCHTR